MNEQGTLQTHGVNMGSSGKSHWRFGCGSGDQLARGEGMRRQRHGNLKLHLQLVAPSSEGLCGASAKSWWSHGGEVQQTGVQWRSNASVWFPRLEIFPGYSGESHHWDTAMGMEGPACPVRFW